MKKYLRVFLPICLMLICIAAFSSCVGDPAVTTPKVTTKKVTTKAPITKPVTTTEPIPEGLVFEAVGENGYAVDYYTGGATNLVIPSTYRGKPVVAIGSYAFSSCEWLESITIPNNVTRIGDSAFQGCEYLTSITIPDSVTHIGEWAFYGCKELTSVYITDVAKWCDISFVNYRANPLCDGADLYVNGTRAVNLIIPDGVTSISSYAFYNCASLTSITLPDSLATIGEQAFYGCENLLSAVFENTTGWTVTSFWYTINLSFTDLANIYTAAEYLESSYYTYEWTRTTTVVTPTTYTPGLEFELTEDETAFIVSAYYGLTTDVIIPSEYKGKPVTIIGEGAFASGIQIKSIYIPSSIVEIGNSAFFFADLVSVTIPDSVKVIGDMAFNYCLELRSVTIGSGVERIGSHAFAACEKLTEVEIPDSVIFMDQWAFSSCEKLASVKLGSGLTSIASHAFSSCERLNNIVIPATVTEINAAAFAYCTGLTSATFEITTNWRTGVPRVDSDDLANPATAAEFLRSTHTYSTWTRK